MKKQLILISLIAALSLSAVSCSSKDSSSESKSSDSSSASSADSAETDDTTDTATTENSETAPTESAEPTTLPDAEELFTYDVPDGFTENPDEHIEVRDSTWYDLGTNAHLIVYPMLNYHQSAHFAGTSIMEDHKADEETKYTDVVGSDLEINGMPAFKFTAKCGDNGFNGDYNAVFIQYGNGDIIGILYVYDESEKDKYEPMCEQLISSVKYHGAPAKDSEENYSTDICSMVVNKDFYIIEKGDKVAVQLNITNSMEEYVSRISISESKNTIEELQKNWEQNDKSENIESGETTVGNYDAEYISRTFTAMDLKLKHCSMYVKTISGSYEIAVICPEDNYDEFIERAKPIFDSLVLGK